MADLSAEPSMEDILSSIKRIIAEEGDAPRRRATPARPARDEVLELSDPLADSPAEPEPAPMPITRPTARPAPAVPSAPAEPEIAAIASPRTAAAARGALDNLARLMVKPEPESDGTLEGLVRELLRPMLREWLDANLPEIVEAMVAREIERITTR
ncbi:MAG: DUF2497 domain-containing protein [Sphingomonas sp.]|nr:DUF2497 domain-containing protein [Sphingomonas sp.]